jgi:hypothetical protein
VMRTCTFPKVVERTCAHMTRGEEDKAALPINTTPGFTQKRRMNGLFSGNTHLAVAPLCSDFRKFSLLVRVASQWQDGHDHTRTHRPIYPERPMPIRLRFVIN